MRTSMEGLMAIAAHEGIVQTAYKDSVGVWTIGIGHTASAGAPDPRKAGKLTISECFNLFRHDIAKYERDVAEAVKVPLKQHEFDALVSFHYNTGAIGKASFVKKLNAGDRAGAIKGIMDWRKPAEIIPRRTAERDLFRAGKYPAPFATLYPATPDGRVQWAHGKRIDLREALRDAAAPASAPKTATAPSPATAAQPATAAPAGGRTSIIAAVAAAVVAVGGVVAAWFFNVGG